jgi:hypothetical protein
MQWKQAGYQGLDRDACPNQWAGIMGSSEGRTAGIEVRKLDYTTSSEIRVLAKVEVFEEGSYEWKRIEGNTTKEEIKDIAAAKSGRKESELAEHVESDPDKRRCAFVARNGSKRGEIKGARYIEVGMSQGPG